MQNDAAFMQDGKAVSAVSTPALFRCHMVPRHVKLNGLFGKKSVCKGTTTAVSLGMALMPLLASPGNFCSEQLHHTVLHLFVSP